jgi:copper chaperone
MSKTILSVPGMSCPSCIGHIKDALAIEGVTNVEVLFERSTVVVEHAPTTSPGRLIAALEQDGYDATIRNETNGSAVGSW